MQRVTFNHVFQFSEEHQTSSSTISQIIPEDCWLGQIVEGNP